jgi:hypothetical protein
LYILPSGGGIASLALLSATADYLCTRKIITTCVHILAAGITPIPITLTVTGKFREDPILVEAQVREALVTWGNPDNQEINKPVRLSDLYGLIDNLSRVDFSNITGISTIPYARPVDGNTAQLNWIRLTLPTCTTRLTYRINHVGSNNFLLYREGIYLQNLGLNVSFTDINITLSIQAGVYPMGKVWEFTVYPSNRDILLDDYTIPTINNNFINLVVVEATSTQNCKPSCN